MRDFRCKCVPFSKVPILAYPAKSQLTYAVRVPSVEEGLVGGPAFGQAQVALALESFERAHQNRFTPGSAARRKKGVECSQVHGTDLPVGDQVGIVLAVAG